MSYFFYLFLIPLTYIRYIYKTSVAKQTTVNSEIYANSYLRPHPPPENKKKLNKKGQPDRFEPKNLCGLVILLATT